MHLNFFLIFAENVTVLSLNNIKLIPFEASTSKYKKSAFTMWLYEGVLQEYFFLLYITNM